MQLSDDSSPRAPRQVKVRRKNFRFDSVSRHWFANSPFATHFCNAMTLIFPIGERYFTRHVKEALDRIQDPDVREAARGFMAQETQHAMQHEAFFRRLREQGFHIDGFLKLMELVGLKITEPLLGRRLNLATVAGFEHFTALMADIALSADVLSRAEDIPRELFEWHAAEEIEHKAVAFDVFSDVYGDYPTRVAGMMIAATLLGGFMAAGTVMLLFQDRRFLGPGTPIEAYHMLFGENQLLPRSFAEFLRYFVPGFHPDQVDNRALAEKVFANHEARQNATRLENGT